MAKKVDVGVRRGGWRVLSRADRWYVCEGKRRQKHQYWKCECLTCGDTHDLLHTQIMRASHGCRSCWQKGLAVNVPPGTRFGSYTVVGRATNGRRGRSRFQCRCEECGRLKILSGTDLRSGDHGRCADCRNAKCASERTTHGASTTPEYQCWRGAKQRCFNRNSKAWEDYGGRGVTMCERWRRSFDAFLLDVGQRPSDRHTLDRVDVDGGYWCGHCAQCLGDGRPANCRWVTWDVQGKNKRRRVGASAHASALAAKDAEIASLRARMAALTGEALVW